MTHKLLTNPDRAACGVDVSSGSFSTTDAYVTFEKCKAAMESFVHYPSKISPAMVSLCHTALTVQDASLDWSKVTCHECLKHRPDKTEIIHFAEQPGFRNKCDGRQVNSNHYTRGWELVNCPECLKHRPFIHFTGLSCILKFWDSLDSDKWENVTCLECLKHKPSIIGIGFDWKGPYFKLGDKPINQPEEIKIANNLDPRMILEWIVTECEMFGQQEPERSIGRILQMARKGLGR